jgi:transcription elongation factor Elf1
MTAKQLPITCPICGKKKEYPVEALVEGAHLECPFCGLKLTPCTVICGRRCERRSRS